jgi:hypothetical protein
MYPDGAHSVSVRRACCQAKTVERSFAYGASHTHIHVHVAAALTAQLLVQQAQSYEEAAQAQLQEQQDKLAEKFRLVHARRTASCHVDSPDLPGGIASALR